MYRSLANFANGTSDSHWIFLHMYSVTDYNQQRLVKQTMATIFKPNLRWALTSYAVDSSQGIFGGVEQLTKTLEDTKKTNTLITVRWPRSYWRARPYNGDHHLPI